MSDCLNHKGTRVQNIRMTSSPRVRGTNPVEIEVQFLGHCVSHAMELAVASGFFPRSWVKNILYYRRVHTLQ